MPEPFASCFNKKLWQNTRATKFRGGYFHGGEISRQDGQSEENKKPAKPKGVGASQALEIIISVVSG